MPRHHELRFWLESHVGRYAYRPRICMKCSDYFVECNKTDTFEILDHYYENGGNFIDR